MLARDPFLAQKYEDYLICRASQFVAIEKPVKGGEGKKKFVTILWPSHIGYWPNEGGLNDQDFLTVKMFAAFLRGEQQAAIRLLETA